MEGERAKPKVVSGMTEGRRGYLESGAVVDLKLVRSEEILGPDEVVSDSKNGTNPSDLESNTIAESVENSRKMVAKYLDEIFRKTHTIPYRVAKVDDRVAGDRINFEQGSNDFIYFISREEGGILKEAMANPESFSIADSGVSFSKPTGVDRDEARESNIGFEKMMEVDGNNFEIKFLYAGTEAKAA